MTRLLCALSLAVTWVAFAAVADLMVGAPRPAGTWAAKVVAQGDACGAIMGADLGLPHTAITVAEEVKPPFTPPETFSSRGFTVEDVSFCRVAGVARPEAGSRIEFEVWLPHADNWNGRFQGIGSGGSAGAIRYRQLAAAVAGGYAAVATDNGHTSTSGFDGSWSLGHPVRLVDFGYRAQHEATVAGKAITRAYYGRDAGFAYFVGCSQGGHHALMEAQRYPRRLRRHRGRRPGQLLDRPDDGRALGRARHHPGSRAGPAARQAARARRRRNGRVRRARRAGGRPDRRSAQLRLRPRRPAV